MAFQKFNGFVGSRIQNKMKQTACSIILCFILLTLCLTSCQSANRRQTAYLGDSQTYKGITIIANSITESDYYLTTSGYKIDAEEGKKFFAVELTIVNNGSSELSLYPSDFHLIETESNAEVESVNYVLDNTILDIAVLPYETVTGIVRFYVTEIFASKTPFIFRYTYTDYDVAFLWEEIEFVWLLTEHAN